MSDNDYLDATELRDALGISQATYYRWVREGKLQGVRVGHRWRFPRAVVEELLPDDAGQGRRRALDRALQIAGQRSTARENAMNSPDNVGRLVDEILHHAITGRASDLHVHGTSGGLALRERIDGGLVRLQPDLPAAVLDDVVAELVRRAGIAQGDCAASGRFFFEVDGSPVDVVASSFPTSTGPSLSLRFLNPATIVLDVERLGIEPDVLRRVRQLLRRSHGVFLCNGPSGSGKTTTLLSLVMDLDTERLKIMTIEDPVEVRLDGLLQGQVAENFGFVEAISAMLRSDVDVGVVGELRDAETVGALFRAAATGHLMFSQLHAADGFSAIQRLEGAGLGRAELAENLLGVLSQRIVPRVCPECRTWSELSVEEAEQLEVPGLDAGLRVARGEGCGACAQRGTRGRVAAYELLEGAAEAGGGAEEVPAFVVRTSLREDMLRLVREGQVAPRAAALALGRAGGR